MIIIKIRPTPVLRTCAITIAIAIIGCARSPEITSIHPEALIVDVRSAEQFGQKHATGAINIPLDELMDRIDELGEQDTKIIVYCNMGRSSHRAKLKLLEAGYRDVKNGGGLDDMLAMERQCSYAA